MKARVYPTSPELIMDGGTLNATRLAYFLQGCGHDVDVFARREPGEEFIDQSRGVRIYRIPYAPSTSSNAFDRDFEEAISFGEQLLKCDRFRPQDYDILHVHHWTSSACFAHFNAAARRLFFTPHLLPSMKAKAIGARLPDSVRAIERNALMKADAIIAVSEAEREDVIRLNPKARCHVIPNGVDDTFFSVPFRGANSVKEHRLVTVARLSYIKGIDILLSAIAQLSEEGMHNFHLVIAGGSYREPEYESEMYALACKEPLRGKVTFVGGVSPHRVPTLLQMCDLYIQPSRYESQGITILEAMAAGCSVVAPKLPSLSETIRHGVNGHTFPTGDAQGLCRCISELMSNPALGLACAKQARSDVSQYSWTETFRRTSNLFHEQC